jgi:hypothetical protein
VKASSKYLSFANVMSCVALFVALSGAAYAATLGKNAVKAENVARGAITTPKLRGGAVTSAKLAKESITRNKLAKNAVGTEQIAGNSVTYAQLTSNSVGMSKILDGSISESKVSETLLKKIVKNVSYASKASDSNNAPLSKSVFVACPFGKLALGGGARIVGNTTGVAITQSMPGVGVGNTAESWSATAAPIAAESNPWAVEAFVVCGEL